MKVIRQLTWVAAMVALMMAAVSCNNATFLNADETEIKAEMTGAKGTIGLHSDATGFELTHSPEWVVASIADSTLTYSMGTNDTKAVRRDSIVVSCGGMSLVIPVEQVVKATKLSVNPEKVEFEKEGGKAEVTVDTDGAGVNVDCPEGITATYADGKLSVVAPKNDKGTIKGEITLTCDELTAKVAVTVKGAVCARCKGTGRVTCSHCKGRGYIPVPAWMEGVGCRYCGGAGSEENGRGWNRCPDCKGTGR
ncbi:MAG: hypothetical protein MJZ74_10955 [Muribaculaceae bacterium]|nr:hypothetical protein [Muribaculaceae bacterium]